MSLRSPPRRSPSSSAAAHRWRRSGPSASRPGHLLPPLLRGLNHDSSSTCLEPSTTAWRAASSWSSVAAFTHRRRRSIPRRLADVCTYWFTVMPATAAPAATVRPAGRARRRAHSWPPRRVHRLRRYPRRTADWQASTRPEQATTARRATHQCLGRHRRCWTPRGRRSPVTDERGDGDGLQFRRERVEDVERNLRRLHRELQPDFSGGRTDFTKSRPAGTLDRLNIPAMACQARAFRRSPPAT